MAIAINTMQRGQDTFQFRRQALLKTTEPFDTTGETSITGFIISGTEPADTNRRIIFEVDGKLWYFTNDGLQQYPYYGNLADVLEYGNTVAELLEVEGIAQWLNKKIYPIIALDAPRNSPVATKIKIGLKVNCFNDEYQRAVFSPVFKLTHAENPARIADIHFEKNLEGYAQAEVLARTLDKFNVWSDWLDAAEIANKEAEAVQFKAIYTLTAIDGTDKAQVTDLTLNYVTDSQNLAGNTREIITVPVEYHEDFQTVYALIKYSALIDARLEAYVKFQNPVKIRKNLLIGRGNGEIKTYYLGETGGYDPNIKPDTIRILAGGKNIIDFYYNTENGTVDVLADLGTEILASYEYDVEAESWLKMLVLNDDFSDGICQTRFAYRLGNVGNKRVSAVKFELSRKVGRVENLVLGTASGKTQTFYLEHRAQKETISVNGDFTYDEDTQILNIIGNIGDTLTVSYDWAGNFPKVYEFITGFSI